MMMKSPFGCLTCSIYIHKKLHYEVAKLWLVSILKSDIGTYAMVVFLKKRRARTPGFSYPCPTLSFPYFGSFTLFRALLCPSQAFFHIRVCTISRTLMEVGSLRGWEYQETFLLLTLFLANLSRKRMTFTLYFPFLFFFTSYKWGGENNVSGRFR